ncbi:hypothetical protein LEP1GSC036_0197 [Leptospira weilii str. 2006001853]|uniref:Uncharacterized protein n=3 Tax=Leptospira weilii TaxID=28184 RepID=A0A828Z2B6_9LEPT|nr:hypothetical protein LEP1GSC036_0197 [Leptospira weilii str. 2006001853]EMJ60762.1 hypothetical protein LEP1GSC051_1552 [Leptospira sp. P2653]EMM70846.1 hypothetical protein LEP1GSC038_0066 [Leptospira weilii str. 2006001855]EMN46773.1 hypothetical protein LEP1GSC086_0954 [Leptospira weilii str. LNT 1234]EMN92470.1 hypothetical protein LEP1GSC108_0244 [Leptospira weilii str. UI 13098]
MSRRTSDLKGILEDSKVCFRVRIRSSERARDIGTLNDVPRLSTTRKRTQGKSEIGSIL